MDELIIHASARRKGTFTWYLAFVGRYSTMYVFGSTRRRRSIQFFRFLTNGAGLEMVETIRLPWTHSRGTSILNLQFQYFV
jgi:hypothetical protein